MRLRALRVREVGCFTEPVAVEDLTGGLDVLAGPNEAGKSTLFRALETLFLESHKTESQKLKESLVPFRGGAPLIEADVDFDGTAWRYRKQYFAGRMAELRSLVSGEILKNADAEARMLQFLGGEGGAGLLWVRQREALDPLPPNAAGRTLVLAAVEHELTTIASGRETEAVRQAAAAELEALVSGKVRKPRGTYKAALDRVAALERSLGAAETAAAAVEQHMVVLAQLRQEAVSLAAPATAAARLDVLTTIDRQLAADDGLARDLEVAREQLDHVRARSEAAAQAATRYANDAEAASLMEREIAEAADTLATLAATTVRLRSEAERAAAERDRTRAEAQSREHAVQGAARQAEIARLALRVAEARAVEGERLRQAAALAANLARSAVAERIEAEVRDIAILEARLAAAAPVVEVTLEKTGAGKISAGGDPLTTDQLFRPLAPLTLVVAGVAAIRISPTGDDTHADLTSDLLAHRCVLAELLGSIAAGSLDEARAKAAERRSLEETMAHAVSRLAALVPEGLLAAQAALAGAERDGPSGPHTPVPLETLECLASAARVDAAATEAACLTAETALGAAVTQHTVETARIEERRRTLAAVSAALPPAAARPARNLELIAASEAAAEALATAAETVALLTRRRVPSAERQRLVAQRTEIAGERDRAERRLREIERESARLEGLIERDAEAATGIELDRLRGEVGQARRDVARIETEIAGLVLLGQTFAAMAAEGEDLFLQPVLQRLAPMLGEIMGADGAAMAGDLGLTGILRGGRSEAADHLSTGTREQIAVLVRLAFGDILASAGRPVPLVLDDALVYSDDERLAKMLGMLQNASQKHQVILLSCRTGVMAGMGFRPLAPRPWRP